MKSGRVFVKRTLLFVSALLLFLNPSFSFGATFCVSNATELQTALTTAQSNGEDDTVQIVQGTYNGNFIYAAIEANSLTVEGGYTSGCASRVIDPANTILDGGGADNVLALVRQVGAADFSLEGLTLQNGSASTVVDGGGLYAKTIGHVTLTNNTFTLNTASYGGGIYGSGTVFTVTNNTISENTASSKGGGIWAKFTHSNNTGELYNNIIWNNTAPAAADLYIDNTANPFFLGNIFNNDFDQSASGTYIVKPFAIDSSNLNNADPLFVSSGNYHLSSSSPCINTGNNAAPSIPATDKDG